MTLVWSLVVVEHAAQNACKMDTMLPPRDILGRRRAHLPSRSENSTPE